MKTGNQEGSDDQNVCLLSKIDAYWKFDEFEGSRIAAIGGYNLTESDGPLLSVEGKLRKALRGQFFDDEGPRVRRLRNYNEVLSNANRDFTVSMWVYLDTGNAVNVLTGRADNQYMWSLGYAGEFAENLFFFGLWGDKEVTLVSSNTFGPVSLRTWYFVVGTYNASTKQVSISVNAGTPDTKTVVGTPNGNAAIGTNYIDVRGTRDQRTDEAGIWARILSPREIQALYNDGGGLEFAEFSACTHSSSRNSRSSIAAEPSCPIGSSCVFFFECSPQDSLGQCGNNQSQVCCRSN